jgi:alcohol dehydrogenase YqhD (iron-dependent ADH family)
MKGTNDRVIAQKGIEKTRDFFISLSLPQKLREVGVEQTALEKMADKTIAHGDVGKFKKLGKKDVLTILKNAF